MNYLKKLGLVGVMAATTVFLFGAVSASAAEFHSSVENATLSGSQEGTHKITIEGATWTCTESNLSGLFNGKASESEELHPEYVGCAAFGFMNVKVNTAGCEYKFNVNTSTFALSSCTSGEIVITVEAIFNTKCVVEIDNQVGINGISYENMTPRTTFTIGFSSTNLKYHVITSTGLCPLKAGGSGENAKYEGLTALTGSGGAELWIE